EATRPHRPGARLGSAPRHPALGQGVWDHRHRPAPALCRTAPQRQRAHPYAALQHLRPRHASAVIMTPGVRKLALIVHLTCSVGWIGAVVAYLALGVAAVTSQDAQTVRGAWIAMEVTGWWAIVPLALAA